VSREQTLPLSERLYRVLILAYPKAFRLKYGRRYVFNLVSPVLFFGGLVGALAGYVFLENFAPRF
jgi:hypothetical protein